MASQRTQNRSAGSASIPRIQTERDPAGERIIEIRIASRPDRLRLVRSMVQEVRSKTEPVKDSD